MKAVSVGDVAAINPRGEKVSPDAEISFVGMAQLDSVSATATPLETRSFADAGGYTVFRDGDVLAAKITPCWENGKVGQAILEHEIGVGSTEFHVIRPSSSLDARYVLHFLRQPFVRKAGEMRMTGSGGQKRVPVEFLSELKIPLPPIEEQRRVAAVLDQADAIRTKRRQTLTLLDALIQSIFHDMFGDPLADSPIRRAAIGSVAQIVTGNSPARAVPANFGDDIEWIKSDNLGPDVATSADERLSEAGRRKARIAPAGSVLVTCIAGSPASIGKASLVDRDVAFNQQINAVLPSSELDPTFLLGQLKVAPDLVRRKSTGGMKGLVNKSAFQSIEVLVPTLDDQAKFVEHVNKIRSWRAAVQRALAADDELFDSLQSRALRGEL